MGGHPAEGGIDDHALRLHRRRHRRPPGRARPLQGQGAARRQHREQVRIHAAIPGTRSAVSQVPRAGARSPRLSLQPVRRAGAWQRAGNRDVLRDELRRDVSDVPEDRRQRKRDGAALPLPEARKTGAARHRGDQVELHEVPCRPRWRGRRALCAERHARIDRTGRREGALMLMQRSTLSRAWLAVAASLLAALTSAAFAHSVGTKTLRVAFPIAETGFDPQAAGDIYSNYVNRAIFDPLYRYDYLARPYKLVPNTAADMPQIDDDGKTWTIHLRKGIYFADDPVFNGKRRELVAADYVYAIKRILDPRLRSNSLQMVDGRFVGADALVAKAKETGHFDYDAPIEGLQAIDRYTLRFKLVFADYELLSNLTTTAMSAVAREVIGAHADASGSAMANPVGTGAYRLKDWRRGQRIVLEANPGYRDERYPTPAGAADEALVKGLAGRRLPLVPNVDISIIEEAQPRLLAFQQ